jgi:potassium-transporting ATPase KdpC subunit
MISHLRPAVTLLGLFTLLTGLVYPALVTSIAQAAFPAQANGSLVRQAGTIVGSELIGQAFDEPRDFWSRPSATAPMPYNAGASAGSNLGPLNPALQEQVARRISALRAADPGNAAPVPVDLVTASGSGLDPHVSPAAAYFQVHRVSQATGLDSARVRRLVDAHVEKRTFGILGEPCVNVLRLNLALRALLHSGSRAPSVEH